jgi:hypothetical protein
LSLKEGKELTSENLSDMEGKAQSGVKEKFEELRTLRGLNVYR